MSMSSASLLLPLDSSVPKDVAQAKNDARLDKVANDFESVYLSQMLEHMFDQPSEESWFGEGTSGEVYRSLLIDEFGKQMSRAGGIGIAAHVKQELMKLQEI